MDTPQVVFLVVASVIGILAPHALGRLALDAAPATERACRTHQI